MATFSVFNENNEADSTNIADGIDPSIKNRVTLTGDVSFSDGLRGGVFGNLSLVTANTAYEVKVGASALVNRKSVTITALDNVFWGLDNTVTTSNGIPLFKNQQIVFAIDANSPFEIWVVASSNNKDVRIVECS